MRSYEVAARRGIVSDTESMKSMGRLGWLARMPETTEARNRETVSYGKPAHAG